MFCIPPHLQEEVSRPRYVIFEENEIESQPATSLLSGTISTPYSPSACRPSVKSLLVEKQNETIERSKYHGLVVPTSGYDEKTAVRSNDVEAQLPLNPKTHSNRLKRIPISIVFFLSFFFLQFRFLPIPILSSSINSISSLTDIFTKPSSGVPPLDTSFVNNCHTLLSPPKGIFTSRLEKIVNVLPEDTVWISEPSTSTTYFLGGFSREQWFLSERPFLISIHNSSIYLLTPSFEAPRAKLIVQNLPEEVKDRVKWVEWKEDQSPYQVLSQYLSSKGIEKFVLDDGVREFIARGLRKALKEDTSGLEDQVREIRERKGDWEIDLLRCANQFTLHAIRKTKERMYIGITESQTSQILEEEMDKTGLIGGEGLVLFGENAALPHGSGTDRRLTKTDLILIDAGGKWGGYVSDITRTFALPSSKIPKSHIELWETVRKSQIAPFELLKSSSNESLTFGELDKSARQVIIDWKNQDAKTKKPRGQQQEDVDFSIFTHRLGHGIGLEGHESPYVIQGVQGKKVIQEGNVFSLEPGIYLPSGTDKVNGLNGIGIRLEDCFVLKWNNHGRHWDGEWLSGPVEKWGDI